MYIYCSVPDNLSAHGRLSIIRDFGPHGIKIPYVYIEAATVAPMRYMGTFPRVGTCPGHYSTATASLRKGVIKTVGMKDPVIIT